MAPLVTERWNNSITPSLTGAQQPTCDRFLRGGRKVAVDILVLQGKEEYPACLKQAANGESLRN